MRKYLKEAFSLAELAIVLTLIGIFAAVVVPIVFHLMPDTDLVKFKKANITLGKAISEVVSSGKYFSPGDLGKDPEGNFITNPKLLCAAMADVMSIKSSACSDNDLGYNTSAVANMVNLSTDEVLAGVKLSDYADCMCAQNI